MKTLRIIVLTILGMVSTAMVLGPLVWALSGGYTAVVAKSHQGANEADIAWFIITMMMLTFVIGLASADKTLKSLRR